MNNIVKIFDKLSAKFPKKIVEKLPVNLNLKRFTFFIFACVLIVFTMLPTPSDVETKKILEFNRNPKNYATKLQIIDLKGQEVANFLVAIADSRPKQIYGLMNLKKLPPENGMFFDFKTNEIIAMWMKNTFITLDMIFIDVNNTIIHIATNTNANSLDIISSQKPASKVLEINGGLVKKLGIKIGQKINLVTQDDAKKPNS
jgi:uncharacterized membrane protein (UPF0127 family)